jgi:hypothetical protein
LSKKLAKTKFTLKMLNNALNVEKDDLFLKSADHPDWQLVMSKVEDIVG